MKKRTNILCGLIASLLFACTSDFWISRDDKIDFKLVTNTSVFVAGKPINLDFYSNSHQEVPQLFIVHSYGKALLNTKSKNGHYLFTIPEIYSKKTSWVSWHLINEQTTKNSGSFTIIPNEKSNTIIENYFGPKSTFFAGGKDFTMVVALPMDGFDNPKKENTAVQIKKQFLQNITSVNLKTTDFIVWHNFLSPINSGKLLVSIECDGISSKEIETDVFPNIATNFDINYSRNHVFADGNQITRFSSSIIRDYFGNIISDGTLVTFIIKTQNNMILKTFGSTINGKVSAQILHPDHSEVYNVKAYITGIAESNSLVLQFKPVNSTFKYTFSNQNRTLVVGPIKSFMNQLIPDGIKVVVKAYHHNKLVATLQEDTSKGFVSFYFSKDFYPEENYRFEISTLGKTKKTPLIYYGNN